MARMLVLGDSILWGQGLNEEDKATSLLRAAWAATGVPVTVHRFAHSGADVWDDGLKGSDVIFKWRPPLFASEFVVTDAEIAASPASAGEPTARDSIGEIPGDAPFVLRQIVDAAAEIGGAPVDLVVVDGGINDLEVYQLVVPGKDLNRVIARARSTRPRIAAMLKKIRATFPNAAILVTGYYPIVSRQTRLKALYEHVRSVAVACGVEPGKVGCGEALPAGLNKPLGALTTEKFFLFRGIARRCELWLAAFHTVLAEEVERLPRARFVDPGFGPEHAAFAEKSLLWGASGGLPVDPKLKARQAWCDANHPAFWRRPIVERAAFGHPNVAGAQRYAARMIEAARALGLF